MGKAKSSTKSGSKSTGGTERATMPPGPVAKLNFRRVMGRFATGVTVITAADCNGRVRGMTANAFMSGSLEPPLCVVSIGKAASMHDVFADGTLFGVNILAHGQRDLSEHFAGRSIAGLVVPFTEIEGVPLLADASAYIAARIEARHDCGDHTLIVGHILAMEADDRTPLLYHAGHYSELRQRPATELVGAPNFW